MPASEAEPQQFTPSALTTLIDEQTPADSVHPEYLHGLALQIHHNLQHQHRWTKLRIHTKSPITGNDLSRPLISGLPPKRLYIHPDEQIELLQAEAVRKKKSKEANGNKDIQDAGQEDNSYAQPEEEWVLPTHLREKWSLKRFAEVFDGISMIPPVDSDNGAKRIHNKWRTTKRLLMATVQDDSTIVYYIVHDGIVKPRQN